MDYLISFAGIGIVVLAAYLIANAVYRRVKRSSGSTTAVIIFLVTFLVCMFLIGFIVLLIMVADGQG